jgi:triacylglycerol lipase
MESHTIETDMENDDGHGHLRDFHRDSLLGGGFSARTALTLARASEVAYYLDEALLRETVAGWGMEPASVFNCDETEGFIALDDELLILAFRGTVSVTDWLRNLKIARTEMPMGRVHEGLGAVWDEQIEPVLRSVADSERRIWITGHSLGGALATLAAARCHEWLQAAGVCTFGQPLVGDRAFAKLFNRAFRDRFHRFVNDRDIVTRVPPAPMFAHVDERVHLGRDGGIVEESATRGEEPEPEGLSEEAFAEMQRQLASDPSDVAERGILPHLPLPFMKGVEDHNLLDGYLPKLRQIVAQGA